VIFSVRAVASVVKINQVLTRVNARCAGRFRESFWAIPKHGTHHLSPAYFLSIRKAAIIKRPIYTIYARLPQNYHRNAVMNKQGDLA